MKMPVIALGVLVIGCAYAGVASAYDPSRGASIASVLKRGDFIPHIPTLNDVRDELGDFPPLNSKRQICYKNDKGILVLSLDEEGGKAITEVAVVNRDLINLGSCARAQKNPFSNEKFHGVSIGDNARKLKSLNFHFSISNSSRFKQRVRIYTFAPIAGEDDLYHSFFVRRGVIVGYAIGVTE